MVQQWFEENAESVWDNVDRPSWKETRIHAKCLRSTDQVRRGPRSVALRWPSLYHSGQFRARCSPCHPPILILSQVKNYFREYRARSKGGEVAPPNSRTGSLRIKAEPRGEQEGDLGTILANHNARITRMGSSTSAHQGTRHASGGSGRAASSWEYEEANSEFDDPTESEDDEPVSRQGSGFLLPARSGRHSSPFRTNSFSAGVPAPTITTGGRSSRGTSEIPAHRLLSTTTTGDLARAFSNNLDGVGRTQSMNLPGAWCGKDLPRV